MNEHDEELARVLAARIFDEAETKRVFKEALNEWLDHKWSQFGKWTMTGILVLLFGALVVFIMWSQGYSKLK